MEGLVRGGCGQAYLGRASRLQDPQGGKEKKPASEGFLSECQPPPTHHFKALPPDPRVDAEATALAPLFQTFLSLRRSACS